ncbi:transcription factor 25 isoform X3 [Otolemur garnettii]|uniref:transcription factor 25 isoform X3 n=1 Tax=Otolemur garnettii TaxID=30611 RepID=UPI000C7EE68C|nr:transcription factor 25 isoform X3 [Otolemur garnettii]
MSRRALRRLRGEQRGQEPLGPGALHFDLRDDDDAEEEGPKRGPGGQRPGCTGKAGVQVNNRFELALKCTEVNHMTIALRREKKRRHTSIDIEDLEDDPVVNGERPDCAHTDTVAPGCRERALCGHTETKTDGDTAMAASTEQSNASGKLRKKKKKQKNKKNSTGETSENGLEDIDRILERIEDSSGLSHPGPAPLTTKKHVLYVQHRHLNPDTELKRYFGARAVLGEQRPRQRQRVYPKCTWLTTPKSTWPRYSKPGLSMRLLESKKGLSFFTFEHSEEYQQAQHKFLAAVESMEPNNIVVLLQTSPYHVDSLLQLSDACRFQEDQEMARDLIERALYSMECAFHPLFSLTSGTCRLDYRRPENRSFYLALYKQMSFLEKRGCPRTALEYCKLILSLEPDEDPLCMLLLVDHLALRARNYEYLIHLFQEWEGHRNLSQLPNFAFSVPLAYFLLSQQTDLPEQELSSAREKASLLIQQALIMFPGVLMPLLEYCSVRPDAAVSSHCFFGPNAEISQPPALSQLVSLYLGRSHFLWKEPITMSWLEDNVREVLQAVDAGDPAVEACESRRKVLYQRAPRNIHRHVILSEIKEAVAALPPDVTTQSVMGFDPLPPLDTIYSYVRPERLSPVSRGNTIALFFRSLLPNYAMEVGGET